MWPRRASQRTLADSDTAFIGDHHDVADVQIRINDVGIIGFELRPVAWRSPSIQAGRDQAEAASPAIVAIREDAVQTKISVFAVLDKEGDPQRPLERSPGGACTRWKSAALSRRTR